MRNLLEIFKQGFQPGAKNADHASSGFSFLRNEGEPEQPILIGDVITFPENGTKVILTATPKLDDSAASVLSDREKTRLSHLEYRLEKGGSSTRGAWVVERTHDGEIAGRHTLSDSQKSALPGTSLKFQKDNTELSDGKTGVIIRFGTKQASPRT